MSDRLQVAVVIPAHNEEETVGGVVAAARACTLVDRAVVVSDASVDRTALRAREAGAEVIESREPLGKGMAIAHGVEATTEPVLIFLDADLRGFTSKHIEALLGPVLVGTHAMNVGIRDRGKMSRLIGPMLPLVSGERALRREVFTSVEKRHLHGYRVEVALNDACRRRGWKYGSVFMPGVHIKTKLEKVGVCSAALQYAKMWWQVGSAMLLLRLQK